jgi:hypothetical protein
LELFGEKRGEFSGKSSLSTSLETVLEKGVFYRALIFDEKPFLFKTEQLLDF